MLEWIFICELIVLAALGLFGLASLAIAKTDKSDPIYVFCSTFWRNFLWPPLRMELDSYRSAARAAAVAPRGDDAFYGRVKKDRDGRIVTATLELLVVPNCVKDQVMGVEEGGLRIQVSGEAGDGRTNKLLVELVANAIDVKPYQVTITKGHYQSRKTVQIQGLRPDELESKLSVIGSAS